MGEGGKVVKMAKGLGQMGEGGKVVKMASTG